MAMTYPDWRQAGNDVSRLESSMALTYPDWNQAGNDVIPDLIGDLKNKIL